MKEETVHVGLNGDKVRQEPVSLLVRGYGGLEEC